MSNTVTFVDPIGPIKTWLRAQTVAGCDARVYIGDPEGATMPYLALTLVDGPVDPGEAPLALPHVQIVAQADTELEAASAIWDLVSIVLSITDGTVLDSTLRCAGARLILGPVFRDDEAGPRYLAEFEFSVVAR